MNAETQHLSFWPFYQLTNQIASFDNGTFLIIMPLNLEMFLQKGITMFVSYLCIIYRFSGLQLPNSSRWQETDTASICAPLISLPSPTLPQVRFTHIVTQISHVTWCILLINQDGKRILVFKVSKWPSKHTTPCISVQTWRRERSIAGKELGFR